MNLKKKIPIFVLTVKGSNREKIIKKKLNKLGLRHKIIYGINAKIKKNTDYLKKIYDKKRANNLLERDLNHSDIACSFGHIKIYKHIVKKNIKYAIIMEDDCHPSKMLVDWSLLNYNLFNKFDFIQFYSNSGLIYKKPYVNLGDNFSLHKAKTHLPLATCYQINLKSCKFLLKYFKEKIFQTNDFPAYYINKKIKQFFVLPIIANPSFNHYRSSSNKNIWASVRFFNQIKKAVPLYNFINSLLHILHIPFIFFFIKKHSYKFYKKHFLKYKYNVFMNFFSKKYLNMPDLINNASNYIK